MPENTELSYTDICNLVDRNLREYVARIRVSENNEKLKKQYEEQLARYQNGLKMTSTLIDIIKPMVDDVQRYLAEKKTESMHNINNAIRLAEEIIPEAENGVHFQLEKNGEAWLSTADGLEVDTSEGGGFRQISSAFIRFVIANSNPSILNTMILDEIFSLVSPENSATLSQYLSIMMGDAQIISIEQKPQVYSNIDYTKYTFNKIGQYSSVTSERVNNGGTENDVHD